MNSAGQAFIDRSRAFLGSEYLPKIRSCLDELPPDALWWRPNAASNSVGNLLLHLSGNLGQWIVSGVGGEPDVRERQAEFDAEGGREAAELLARLEATVADADRVLAGLDPGRLLEARVVQGTDTTVLDAIYHVVEHFGMHTGQIAYITKMRTGEDLGFYDVEDGIARPTW
ncbi:MAG TPA: DinB family protein [Gemmatimonadota bacterium]|nr:DinB family protein [Gemmatimonadota bacterium]